MNDEFLYYPPSLEQFRDRQNKIAEIAEIMSHAKIAEGFGYYGTALGLLKGIYTDGIRQDIVNFINDWKHRLAIKMTTKGENDE